jgi:hypothetical protein
MRKVGSSLTVDPIGNGEYSEVAGSSGKTLTVEADADADSDEVADSGEDLCRSLDDC